MCHCGLVLTLSLSLSVPRYFADCGKARARDDAYEPDHARRLWEVSEELVKSILHGETAE